MTTAHRPTYNPTKGSNMQGGNKLYFPSLQFSAKDLPSNLKVKTRRTGQGTTNEVKRKDFKRELLQRELKGKNNNTGLVSSLYDDENNLNLDIKADITDDLKCLEPTKKQRLESISDISEIKPFENVFPQDRDLEFSEDGSEKQNNNVENKNSISDFDDEEDEEEQLLKELEKIKKEREDENKKKDIEKNLILEVETREKILNGNPLLNNTDYSLKKKWYEDTVFKNQANNEPKTKKRFINDTVRSDFHRKFLSKTVQ